MSHFVLELFFDVGTERAIYEWWRAIDAVPGWTPPTRDGARPHLSICSCPSLDERCFRAALADIAEQTPPLSVAFASVAAFPSAEGVVFLAPVVTAVLLALHARLVEALQECGAVVPALYAPGNWVPHCTLASGLPSALVTQGVALVLRAPTPLVGRIESIGLLEVAPPQHRIVAFAELADAQEEQNP